MKLEIWVSDKIGCDRLKEFERFLQDMASCRDQGYCRYGKVNRNKEYMDRLSDELRAYRKRSGGNRAQLLNLAVYAFLESIEPQHKGFHYDPEAKTVNRKRMNRKKEWLLN